MKHYSFLNVVAVLCLYATYGCVPAFGQRALSWTDRFTSEAPSAWDQYRQRAKRLQGSISINFDSVSSNKRIPLKRQVEFKQREGCALHLQQSFVGEALGQTGSVKVLNKSYNFELQRHHPDSPWVVSKVGPNSATNGDFHFLEDVDLWSTCPINFGLVHSSLRVIPLDPGFVVKQVAPATAPERKGLVEVVFEYHPEEGKPRSPSITGWVCYDPDHYWVIKAYDLHCQWAGIDAIEATTASFEYDMSANNFPILRRIDRSIKIPKKSYESKDVYELVLKEADVPESEFTLAAFGLPESLSLTESKPRWFLWIGVAGIGSLVIAWFCRWLARKRRRNLS